MRDVFDSIDQLLVAHGVSRPMQQAAHAALHRRQSQGDFRTRIVTGLILAGGLYVVFALSGAGSRPYLAMFIAALLVVVVSLADRATTPPLGAACRDLLQHTRTRVDFRKLADDIYYYDPAIARDLHSVLSVGIQDPAELSDYSVLHLWECLRQYAASERRRVGANR